MERGGFLISGDMATTADKRMRARATWFEDSKKYILIDLTPERLMSYLLSIR
ncbi:MAG: hypothetical protein CM15mP75_6280 [Flammeovirgaceae bacterium]|nr:MAG: hypothetical protein CM15mP75_6280 [Flammeovirgaceae bacterium]